MAKPACTPCGFVFESTRDYLEHVAKCARVLPSANRAAEFWLSELKRNGEPPKKKRRVKTDAPTQERLL